MGHVPLSKNRTARPYEAAVPSEGLMDVSMRSARSRQNSYNSGPPISALQFVSSSSPGWSSTMRPTSNRSRDSGSPVNLKCPWAAAFRRCVTRCLNFVVLGLPCLGLSNLMSHFGQPPLTSSSRLTDQSSCLEYCALGTMTMPRSEFTKWVTTCTSSSRSRASVTNSRFLRVRCANPMGLFLLSKSIVIPQDRASLELNTS